MGKLIVADLKVGSGVGVGISSRLRSASAVNFACASSCADEFFTIFATGSW